MSYRYSFFNINETTKLSVWNKGRSIPGYDSNVWRVDACNHVIKYSEHGNTDSDHGWEIDHILPTSSGGGDNIDNLQPLYWLNNRRKGDTYPWYCENAA